MKNIRINQIVLGVCLTLFTAGASHAATSSVSSSSNSSPRTYGLGFATTGNFLSSSTAVTGWVSLANKLDLQAYLALPSTSPVTFMVGGIVKYSVYEVAGATFHLGGGLALGAVPRTVFTLTSTSSTVFGISVAGVAGFHFFIPGTSRLLVNIDGGPILSIVDGNTNFAIDALSPGLGASIIFLF